MKCTYYPKNLAFHHPFTISKGTKTHQPTLIVELDFAGIKGYGESPAIIYYDVTLDSMIADIVSKKLLIEKYAFTEPGRYWHYLHHLLPKNNFLVCALDMAAWDIYGKIKRQPLYRLWNLDLTKAPLTDYTIGIDTVEKMTEKIDEKPWPVYKIKVGRREDLATLQALTRHTRSVVRVDANAGWTKEEALDLLPQLAAMNVELVEQPLAKDDWEGMRELYERSPLPLIADESCVTEGDVDKCNHHFHGINIKLTKCSGITPALRMISRARELGLKLMLGSMNESTIGSAAIGHLSPLVDYVDMDGPLLLKEDLASGVVYDYGKIILSGEPGLGIRIKDALISSPGDQL